MKNVVYNVVYVAFGLIVAVVCMAILTVGEFGAWLARVAVFFLCKTSKAGDAYVAKACKQITGFIDRIDQVA